MGNLIEMERLVMPARTVGSLARYFLNHIPPGHFVEAVLLNDLYGAVLSADGDNQRYLANIVKAVTNYLPMSITKQGYSAWLENENVGWHDQAVAHHGKRWEPYLNM